MIQIVIVLITYLAFVVLLGPVGNSFCRKIIEISGVKQRPENAPQSVDRAQSESQVQAGRYIGIFERFLVCIGIIAGTWEVLVAVIALKTVARYKELDEQLSAEYFLIGSLASLLWAVVITLAIANFDSSQIGFHLGLKVQNLLPKP